MGADKKQELVNLYVSAQNEDGGFGGNVGHDSHITSSHYSLLVLSQFGALDQINQDGLVKYITKLQKPDVRVFPNE